MGPSAMPAAGMLLPRRRLAFVLVAALACSAVLHRHSACPHRQSRPGQAHNPLELWNVGGVREELGAGAPGAPGIPSIRCNTTRLRGAHEWVEVTWSGLPAGARVVFVVGGGVCVREGQGRP